MSLSASSDEKQISYSPSSLPPSLPHHRRPQQASQDTLVKSPSRTEACEREGEQGTNDGQGRDAAEERVDVQTLLSLHEEREGGREGGREGEVAESED